MPPRNWGHFFIEKKDIKKEKEEVKHNTATVILECYKVGDRGEGSEPGTSRAWVETLLDSPKIEKIHLITSSIKNPPITNKLSLIIVREKTYLTKVLYWINNHLGKNYKIAQAIFYLNYINWLKRSLKKIKHQDIQADLAIHGSYCSLKTGTELHKTGIRTLCHGSVEENKEHTIKPYHEISTPNRSQAIKNKWHWLRDPFFPPEEPPIETTIKTKKILFIDHENPRKNSAQLRKELEKIKKENYQLPITILTSRKDWWGDLGETQEKVSKKEYLKLLSSHSHLLNMSTREGSCTSAMEALFLNTKIIGNNVIGYDEEIPKGWITKKTKRIDYLWEEIKEKEISPIPKEILKKTMGLSPARQLIETILETINI